MTTMSVNGIIEPSRSPPASQATPAPWSHAIIARTRPATASPPCMTAARRALGPKCRTPTAPPHSILAGCSARLTYSEPPANRPAATMAAIMTIVTPRPPSRTPPMVRPEARAAADRGVSAERHDPEAFYARNAEALEAAEQPVDAEGHSDPLLRLRAKIPR